MYNLQVRVVQSHGAEPSKGSAGYDTQIGGLSATVSNLAGATGGIRAGGFVKPDI